MNNKDKTSATPKITLRLTKSIVDIELEFYSAKMTRLRILKNAIRASAAFIIGGTILLFSLFVEATANEHNIVDNEIVNSLNSMGYRNVSLDECVIEFHREITPTPENNYFNSYYRRINLRNLILSELGEVEKAPFNEKLGIDYRFMGPFNIMYEKKFLLIYLKDGLGKIFHLLAGLIVLQLVTMSSLQ